MSNGMAQRIKTLRKENNLTLEQVANIVGVGKSTVRKWETGMIANMKRDKISALAQALNTTPAYLMGWDEENEKNSPEELKLAEGEKMLLDLFNQVPKENQEMVLDILFYLLFLIFLFYILLGYF